MKRRAFLRTSVAAGVAGLATPSLMSASERVATSSFRVGPFGLIPDPPFRLQNNENPRGLSPAAKQAIIDAFPYGSLYGGGPGNIEGRIAEIHGVDTQFVAVGNGSGDTLRQAPQAIGANGMHLIAADPTYGDGY